MPAPKQECTVCQRDRPAQYNSIYRACNGTDREDVVVCALNPPQNSYPGDECLPGYFAYGRLDAIDTELMRMEEESLNTTFAPLMASGAVVGPLHVMYDAVSHYVDRYNPVLLDGGYFISSRAVVDMSNGAVVARNTRIESFHVSFSIWISIWQPVHVQSL